MVERDYEVGGRFCSIRIFMQYKSLVFSMVCGVLVRNNVLVRNFCVGVIPESYQNWKSPAETQKFRAQSSFPDF